MYVQRLEIDGLKLLRNFTLDFTRDGAPRMWTVLVGRNGLCKTSILRAIALAASGRELANELSSGLRGSFPDERRQNGVRIDATFGFGEVGDRLNRPYPGNKKIDRLDVQLELAKDTRSFTGKSSGAPASASEDLLEDARRHSMPHWFVAGYGVQRTLPSNVAPKTPEDFVRVRLDSLFDKGGLISTDFVDHLAKQFGTDEALAFSDVVAKALLSTPHLLPQISRFERRGQGGVSNTDRFNNSHRFHIRVGSSALPLPATWLSHGYQATIAWLADLVGHVIWEARIAGRKGAIAPADLEGLVLVDELDLHLHPEWQVGLIAAIKQTFPRLQFIVTTHSPLLLNSLEPDEIVMLDQDPETGDITATSDPRTPKLQTSGELLERYFGIDELHPSRLAAKFQRYGFLAHNPYRSDEEEQEMQALLAELEQEGIVPTWMPMARRAR